MKNILIFLLLTFSQFYVSGQDCLFTLNYTQSNCLGAEPSQVIITLEAESGSMKDQMVVNYVGGVAQTPTSLNGIIEWDGMLVGGGFATGNLTGVTENCILTTQITDICDGGATSVGAVQAVPINYKAPVVVNCDEALACFLADIDSYIKIDTLKTVDGVDSILFYLGGTIYSWVDTDTYAEQGLATEDGVDPFGNSYIVGQPGIFLADGTFVCIPEKHSYEVLTTSGGLDSVVILGPDGLPTDQWVDTQIDVQFTPEGQSFTVDVDGDTLWGAQVIEYNIIADTNFATGVITYVKYDDGENIVDTTSILNPQFLTDSQLNQGQNGNPDTLCILHENGLWKCHALSCCSKSSDLSITKTVNQTIVEIGDVVTYCFDIANLGAVDAPDVIIQDFLPTGISYISNDGTGNFIEPVMSWFYGILPAGVTDNLCFDAVVESTADLTTALTNTVTIESSNSDSDLSNNYSSVDISGELCAMIAYTSLDAENCVSKLSATVKTLVTNYEISDGSGGDLAGGDIVRHDFYNCETNMLEGWVEIDMANPTTILNSSDADFGTHVTVVGSGTSFTLRLNKSGLAVATGNTYGCAIEYCSESTVTDQSSCGALAVTTSEQATWWRFLNWEGMEGGIQLVTTDLSPTINSIGNVRWLPNPQETSCAPLSSATGSWMAQFPGFDVANIWHSSDSGTPFELDAINGNNLVKFNSNCNDVNGGTPNSGGSGSHYDSGVAGCPSSPSYINGTSGDSYVILENEPNSGWYNFTTHYIRTPNTNAQGGHLGFVASGGSGLGNSANQTKKACRYTMTYAIDAIGVYSTEVVASTSFQIIKGGTVNQVTNAIPFTAAQTGGTVIHSSSPTININTATQQIIDNFNIPCELDETYHYLLTVTFTSGKQIDYANTFHTIPLQ